MSYPPPNQGPPQQPPGYPPQQPQQGYPPQPGYPAQQGYPPQQPPGFPAPPPPGPNAHPGYGYRAPLVSNGKRFGAYLLEVVLVIVTLVIGWFIWYLIAWSNGQTPAKQVLKMRCMKVDSGQPATWGTMALRELVGKMILGNITFGITTIVSAFMILLTDERQGIWDKIAGTVVVDES